MALTTTIVTGIATAYEFGTGNRVWGLALLLAATLAFVATMWFAKREDPEAIAAIPVGSLSPKTALFGFGLSGVLLTIGIVALIQGLSGGGLGPTGFVLGPINVFAGVVIFAGSFRTIAQSAGNRGD
ncbi:MAG: hypothetical protein ACRD2W_09180 [Acidimicrobiales bacterium]